MTALRSWLLIAGVATTLLAGQTLARAAPAPLVCAAGDSCEGAPLGYQPAYPSGSEYDTFIGPVHGSFIPDGDGDGDYADERCDTNRSAQLAEVESVLALLVAIGATCEALPAGPNVACVTPPLVPAPGAQEFCHIPLAAIATGLEVDSIYVTRCDMQGRFVNGSETEAAYENTKLLLGRDLEEHLRTCNPLLGLWLPRSVGGRLEEVRDFVGLRIAQYQGMDAASPEDLSEDIAKAQKKLDAGEAFRARENWKEAYRGYCDAYRELRLVSP